MYSYLFNIEGSWKRVARFKSLSHRQDKDVLKWLYILYDSVHKACYCFTANYRYLASEQPFTFRDTWFPSYLIILLPFLVPSTSVTSWLREVRKIHSNAKRALVAEWLTQADQNRAATKKVRRGEAMARHHWLCFIPIPYLFHEI